MQLSKAVKRKIVPHFLAIFQWAFLITSLAFNINFAVLVTGSTASGGMKVIMLFNLLMFLLPAVSCLMFFTVRKEGIAERCIIGLSVMTILFSVANISLHFVNGFVLLMKATEVIAWGLYNITFSVSVYKISAVFLLPVLSRIEKIGKETRHNDKKLWA